MRDVYICPQIDDAYLSKQHLTYIYIYTSSPYGFSYQQVFDQATPIIHPQLLNPATNGVHTYICTYIMYIYNVANYVQCKGN